MRLPPLAPATALAAAFLVAPPLGAGTPRIAVTAGARDFLAGDTKGVAVSADGRLMLGAALAARAWPDDANDAAVFGAAADSSGRVFVATGGGRGRLFVSTDAKVTLLFDAPEPNITAVAVAPDGLVVCASSPNGKIYRVDPKATDPAKAGAVLAEPKEAAIWALAFARDGTLYVGTGNKGRVYRKTPSGGLELFHEIEDVHVRTLAVGPDGTVYAGTSDRGLVVALPVQGSPRTLYDSRARRFRVSPWTPAVSSTRRHRSSMPRRAGRRRSSRAFGPHPRRRRCPRGARRRLRGAPCRCPFRRLRRGLPSSPVPRAARKSSSFSPTASLSPVGSFPRSRFSACVSTRVERSSSRRVRAGAYTSGGTATCASWPRPVRSWRSRAPRPDPVSRW